MNYELSPRSSNDANILLISGARQGLLLSDIERINEVFPGESVCLLVSRRPGMVSANNVISICLIYLQDDWEKGLITYLSNAMSC